MSEVTIATRLELRIVEDPALEPISKVDHLDRVDLFELIFIDENGRSVAYSATRDEMRNKLIKMLQRLERYQKVTIATRLDLRLVDDLALEPISRVDDIDRVDLFELIFIDDNGRSFAYSATRDEMRNKLLKMLQRLERYRR